MRLLKQGIWIINGSVAAGLLTMNFMKNGGFKKHLTIYAKEKQKQQETLVCVHMFTRHGARTPLSLINGLEQAQYDPETMKPFVKANVVLRTLENEPFNDSLLSHWDQLNYSLLLRGEIPRGHLTRVGEEQLYNLGKRIRKKYIEELKFLSSDYDPNQIYTRSSHYKRTINSAKSMLAGMFLSSNEIDSNKPFIIHVQHLKDDILFPNSLNCKYFTEMHKFQAKLNLFTKNKDYIRNLIELREELKLYHMDNDTKMNFTMFRDDLSARSIHGLTVPDHLNDLYKRSHKYANMELTAASKHNIQIACGQLINLIKENLIATLENEKSPNRNADNHHRFRYYSAHDSTLNALLVALNLDHKNHLWPPFAADLIIELWKEREEDEHENEKYFIRIFYCGEPVEMLECQNGEKEKSAHFRCSISDFIKLLEKSSIDRHAYDNLCRQTFKGE